ncbi:MAG: hypothetical protein MZV65_29175 [Chromatiales bacterium]|nr:hypothetical protein [Chromatiales bacterium]
MSGASSQSPGRAGRRAAFLPSSLACGKKGPLRPPLRLVPQTAEGLRAFQRGARIVLEWTQPDAYQRRLPARRGSPRSRSGRAMRPAIFPLPPALSDR